MSRPPSPSDPVARAAEVVTLGLLAPRGAIQTLLAAGSDTDPRVRAAAVAALVRAAAARTAAGAWRRAARDPDPLVRRRAAETAPALGRAVAARHLVGLLADPDAGVAETAAWALGEHPAPGPGATAALAGAARHHDDPLVREAAVAALGAVGDPHGLPAVLSGLRDRPAVRRRAVLALSAFDGPEVESALARACFDRDRQVRDAAAALLGAASDAPGAPAADPPP